MKELEESLPETNDPLEKAEIKAQIGEIKAQRSEKAAEIIRLYDTFDNVELKLGNQKKAKLAFEKGNLEATRSLLLRDLQEFEGKNKELGKKINRQSAKITHWQEQKKGIAEHYRLLAQTTVLTEVKKPQYFKKVCEYFEKSISIDANADNIAEYVAFLRKHNGFPQAISFCEGILKAFDNKLFRGVRISLLNHLGILYDDRNLFSQSEINYLEALRLARELANVYPKIYRPYISSVLNNLGIVHWKLNKFRDAEDKYLEALDITRSLAMEEPEKHLPHLANMLSNLALLYKNLTNYSQAHIVFSQAIETYGQLKELAPLGNQHNIATIHYNIGVLYMEQEEYQSAETEFNIALQLFEKLRQSDDEKAYLADIAMTKNNLGFLFTEQDEKRDRAESEIQAALSIYQKLLITDSKAYFSDICDAMHNLAYLYEKQKKDTEAEIEYVKVIEGRYQLVKENPEANGPDLVKTLICAARFYQNRIPPEKERSIELSLKALQIIKPFLNTAPYTQKFYDRADEILRSWKLSERK